MSHNQIELEFKQSLESTDYGLIVSKDGLLKGIWVPHGMDINVVPEVIAKMCVEKFGIDPNADYENPTLY